MSEKLRIAVRKFEPFESAIRKQFADFAGQSGGKASLEIDALDLNPLHDSLFAGGGLRDGRYDVAFLPTDWIAEALQLECIEDLNPHLAREPIVDFPDAWSPSLMTLQRHGGGFWGMPYHDGPQCLIYRKDLLAKSGLSVPRTWNEFHAAARTLHAPHQGRYGTVLAQFPDGHNGFYDFCIHIWTRGGEPFGPDGRPDLTSDAAIAALDFIRELARDDSAVAPNANELDSVKSGLLFAEGKVALMTNWFGFAVLGETWSESAVKGLVDIAPLPAGEGGKSVSLNVYWMLAIAKGSKNKPLAWSFLRHAASAEMDKLTTMEGAIGVRRSTWDDVEVNRSIPYYRKLGELHEVARELPRHPRLAEISHVVDEALAKATGTTVPSVSILREAERRMEEIGI